MITLLKKFDPLTISTLTAETSIGLQKIALPAEYQSRVNDFVALEVEVATDPSVAPGSGKTLTAYAAFSAEDSTYTAAELKTAADSLACALQNTANVRRLYSLPLYNVSGKFLYFWFDHDAISAGLTVTVRVSLRN